MSADSPLPAFGALVRQLMLEVETSNLTTLEAAGAAIAPSLAAGGMLHVFGSGHSQMVAQEIVHRAGGLVPVSAIIDPCAGMVETLPGYGRRLVDRYAQRFGLQRGEGVVVISNSGKNPSPVEVAQAAKERGAIVVAITSVGMSRAAKPLTTDGKKLFEVADFVLDNRGPDGDAAFALPGLDEKVGPTSTFTGGLLISLLSLQIIHSLHAQGHEVPLLRSANTPGGKERNAPVEARYRARQSRFF